MKEFKLKNCKYGSQIIDIDNKSHTVKAILNSFNVVDDQSDMSLQGSFKKTISENFKNIFWYKNHDPRIMLGIPLELGETNEYLYGVSEFAETPVSEEMFEFYSLYAKHGRSIQHSVAVIPIKYFEKDGIYHVQEWKMREFSSLTMSGSNPITDVLELKNSSENIELLKDALNLKTTDTLLKKIEKKLNTIELSLKMSADEITDFKPIISGFDKLNQILINNKK